MADDEIRELERIYNATGDPRDREKWRLARERAGLCAHRNTYCEEKPGGNYEDSYIWYGLICSDCKEVLRSDSQPGWEPPSPPNWCGEDDDFYEGNPFTCDYDGYRRNSDATYRAAERSYNSSPSLEGYAKLLHEARRVGLPPPHPPLVRWQSIVDDWSFTTWDTVVEGGTTSKADGFNPEEITPEESSLISRLDFYGKPVEPEHAVLLANKTDKTVFETLEAASNYVNDRLPDRTRERIRGNEFSTDYAHYELEGFTFNDMEGLELENPNVLDGLIRHPNGNYWSPPEDDWIPPAYCRWY
jgi:hypothetical protein